MRIEPAVLNGYDSSVILRTDNMMRCVVAALLLIAAFGVLLAHGDDTLTSETLSVAIADARAIREDLSDELTAELSAAILLAMRDGDIPTATLEIRTLLDWQQASGGWGYGPGHAHTDRYPEFADLGNTHLAITALRRAERLGIPVAEGVFQDAGEFARSCQNEDGGFGLTPPVTEGLRLKGTSHGSATLAGLAVLMTDLGYREDNHNLDATLKGVKWMSATYDPDDDENWQWGDGTREMVLYFWRLADFMSVSHFRELEGHPLRDDIAEGLLNARDANGTWAEGDLQTILAGDALSRVIRPVLVNRLDTSAGDLGQDMTRWMDTLNEATDADNTWQRISWTSRYSTLGEAPLWVVLADDTLNMSDQTVSVIRQFVLDGGTFVVQLTDGDGRRTRELATFFEEHLGVAAWSAKELAGFDGVLDAVTPISTSDAAGAMGVGGNIRLAVAILPASVHAKLLEDTPAPGALGLMDNLAGLATASETPTGDSPYAPSHRLPETTPNKGLAVARIIHGGDWNCCPMVFTRLSHVLAGAVSIGVREQLPVDLNGPVGSQIRLLWLTGSEYESLSSDQKDELVAFLDRGGTLFIDAATGDKDFLDDVREDLDGLIDEAMLKPLDTDHPLLSGDFGAQSGSDLSEVTHTESVSSPPRGAELEGIELDGRVAVILSPWGVTASAEGSPAWKSRSLATDDARRLAANVLLYVLSQPID